MRLRRLLALSALAAAGAALAGASGLLAARPAGAADPVPAARTAVADVVALLNDSPRKKVVEANHGAAKERILKFSDGEQERIEGMRKDILSRAKADPAREKLETEYARAKVVAEFEVKAKVAEAERAYSDALESLYEEVKNAVREVAEQQGFAIVLNVVKEPLDLRNSPGGFVPNIAARPVLYASSAIDITALVRARLEAARPPAPAGPGAVPPAPVRPPAPLPASAGPGALPPPSRPLPPTPGMG